MTEETLIAPRESVDEPTFSKDQVRYICTFAFVEGYEAGRDAGALHREELRKIFDRWWKAIEGCGFSHDAASVYEAATEGDG